MKVRASETSHSPLSSRCQMEQIRETMDAEHPPGIAYAQLYRSERTGNWKPHLGCVQQIIPHFHVAGHLPYAKTARLYLQQRKSIE